MSGIFAQIGYAEETTYGEAVTVTRFIPLVDESLTQDIERLESEGIIAGARLIRSEQWGPGRRIVSGDVGHEWMQQNSALLFEHMLGTITSSFTNGIGTHTATLGSLTGKSMTVQVGKPMVGGTVVPFTYIGCKVQSWTLAVATGEIATLGLTLLAKSETNGIALASASYGTDAAKPFRYTQGAVSISGSSVCVRSLEVSGENMLADDRECVGQDTIDEPVEMDRREITGTATMEFQTTQQYQRFLDGVEVPLVLTMSASASAQAIITMNVRYDGATPEVSGRDLIVTDIPFKVVGTTSDSAGFTAVLKTAQSEL
jgi:hypothetical protein